MIKRNSTQIKILLVLVVSVISLYLALNITVAACQVGYEACTAKSSLVGTTCSYTPAVCAKYGECPTDTCSLGSTSCGTCSSTGCSYYAANTNCGYVSDCNSYCTFIHSTPDYCSYTTCNKWCDGSGNCNSPSVSCMSDAIDYSTCDNVCVNGFQTCKYKNCGTSTKAPCKPQCSNTLDDDGDGKIDQNDPGCWSDCAGTYNANDDNEADDITCPFQCGDGADNDGDGKKDCADQGCWTDCGDPDFGIEPSCDPSDINEANDISCSQCDDKTDNDADTKIDHSSINPVNPDDGCKSSIDTTECFDDSDFVPDTYTSKDGQCCSGKYDYFNQKCIPASNPCAKKYTDSINCNADPDCNWCSGLCQTKACNSCITDKATCTSKGCAWCNGVCQPPVGGTYAGPCSGANSCPGADVTVDMQKGNEISGCLNQDTQFTLSAGYQGQWWKIKGALGQPVNITFLSNYELNFKLWNITNDCSKLFNNIDLVQNKCTPVSYTPSNKCSPAMSVLCQGSGVKTCIIDKMPPGGVLVAVDSDCDTPAPYKIQITPNITLPKCSYA